MAAKLEGLEDRHMPYVNLLERKSTQWALTLEEMKNCMWLKPKLAAQIEFVEWMSDGELRRSRFVRLRQDKEVADIIPEE
jgi:ATP-dependent DNA ligase